MLFLLSISSKESLIAEIKSSSLKLNKILRRYFSFLELSREAFKHIVLSEIEKSKQEYTGNLSYSAYLKSNITKASKIWEFIR